MPSGLGTAERHKWPMDNLSLGPCGLNCQQLGLHRYTCGGNNSVRGHLASGVIVSHPAPLACSLGEDDSPKPSCNTLALAILCNATSTLHPFFNNFSTYLAEQKTYLCIQVVHMPFCSHCYCMQFVFRLLLHLLQYYFPYMHCAMTKINGGFCCR